MSDPQFLSGEVRNLAKKCLAGKHDGPDAFGNLISRLLHLTVAKQNEVLRLDKSPHPNTFIFGGALEATDPILLNNKRYLRITINFHHSQKTGITVERASYQYQLDREDNRRWMFRYDYLKNQPRGFPYPPSHFQMNAKFIYAPEHRDIHKVHFPARKFSLLDIIRLLAEEFHVPCNKPVKIWKPVLAECEGFFQDLA